MIDKTTQEDVLITFVNAFAELMARREQETKTTPADYWTWLHNKHARFNPAKPVNWTEYGYKRDKNGRWYYARKKRPSDLLYDVLPDND